MKTHTIHETNTELLFVPYPNDGGLFTTGITDKITIPDGFEFLGLTDQVKEKDLEGVIEPMIEILDWDKNSDVPNVNKLTLLESLTSLMDFLELPNQPHVLLTRKI